MNQVFEVAMGIPKDDLRVSLKGFQVLGFRVQGLKGLRILEVRV